MRFLRLATLAAMFVGGAQAATIHNSSGSFISAVGTAVTDGFGVAEGYPAGFGIYSNSTMNAYFGETRYVTTGFANWNILQGGGTYCAGCNGSFLLDFTATSLGTAQGVYGVGLDILGNDSSTPYFAFVTFGDDTTLNHALPTGTSYFGITDPLLIKSIHFGLSGGGATTGGGFFIDNLTIAAAAQIPEPASVMLLGSALAALAILRRMR
jgi:hypothetical protein